MKIHALLCWYDEDPAQLAAVVKSAATLCDHVLAVDGAWKAYPNGAARSHPLQALAIQDACDAAGLACTMVYPGAPWLGNEVEKRAAMFRFALAASEPDDWFVILDADMVVTHGSEPEFVRDMLAQTTADVAEVTLWSRATTQTVATEQSFRSLFRALPGLTVEGLHYVYTTVKDGRRVFLWHPPDNSSQEPEPALDLSAALFIEHLQGVRSAEREAGRTGYYNMRHTFAFEKAPQYEEASCL